MMMKKLKDRAQEEMRRGRQPLDVIFCPRSVAVVGATERVGSVGRTVLANLLREERLAGKVFPINPQRPSVLGVKAYKSIEDVGREVDLAVVVTPAETVPGVISQCAEAGVGGAVVLSAGFRETGGRGAELEKQVLEEARRQGMRLIGPTCLGVMNPLSGLNATFAGAMARPGNVAFLSQSGALCTAILDWSLRELVGFSAFVSTGSMLDVGWGDLIDYFGNDPHTKSILIYMESIGDARSFLSAAREVALSKPIIVIKAGRTEAAAKAAASHTGSLAGGDDVVDAAFRRAGVLRVNNISDLFYMAEVLARQPRPKGPRLMVLTNAGGPGVLAADALILAGGELAALSPQTTDSLNKLLPVHWSHNNPVDVLGDAGPERYAESLRIAAEEPNSDGMLVILTPQDMTDPTKTAEALAPYAKIPGKPVLASWMGGPGVDGGVEALNRAGIPTFPYPDTAAKAFQYMWRYTYNLRGLYETPVMTGEDPTLSRSVAQKILDSVRQEGRTLLNEVESKKLLAAYEIPTVATEFAADPDAAVKAAEAIGYPVVLKVFSNVVTHKTDVGGVRLNLAGPAHVRDAFEQIRIQFAQKAKLPFEGVTVQKMIRDVDGYEIIVGSSIDPQFGPVLLFGAGGQLVEVFRDKALALPPLNTTLARRMMEQTKIFKAFKGVRGRKPVDVAAVAGLLVRFGQLVVENPWIKEIDINPLMASAHHVLALDARVLMFPKDTPVEELPKPAIRPYPTQYVRAWKMKNGRAVTIRPIRPEDEPLVARFHETLSDRSVHLRYFHAMKLSQRIDHERLLRICFSDYDRGLALVAEADEGDGKAVLGIARLNKIRNSDEAEFALIVSDAVHGQGLGGELLRRLIDIARQEGVKKVVGSILPDNQEMQRLCEKLGFKLERELNEGTVWAELTM
jgi:acetyltransferase